MKKCLVFSIAFLTLFVLSFKAVAAPDYVINSYDINMVVNEDNTFNITEKIGAYFNVPKHGIMRKLPLKNEVVRLDGTKSYNRAKISDIAVSDPYTVSNQNGNSVIKIGAPDRTLTGAKDYSLSYKYNIGKDTGKGYDELYFNLIGTEWDATIGNISFVITMPKSFDKNKLGFSAGEKSSTESGNVSYTVKGNVITGHYSGVLYPGQSLTVRLELPEGYFVGASNNLDFTMWAALLLSLFFVVFYFFLWLKFGKDKAVVETVEFYPPGGFNSAELGFLYKGKAEDKDIVSLLVYLANKGYIKITETDKKSSSRTAKGFKITKVKEYDGDNVNEKIFLKGLFSKSGINFAQVMNAIKNRDMRGLADGGESVNEVTERDLYNSFYVTLGIIETNLNDKKNKEKIFEKGLLRKDSLGIAMIIAIILLITARPVLEYGGAETLHFALLFPGIGFSMLLISLVWGPRAFKLFAIPWGILFGGVPWYFLVLPALSADPIYVQTYVVGFICILAIMILIKLMPKRTPYGNQILGKIRGFKKFLETAEKERLEELVLDDPEYFYNILPFTYVLGVSDKWIKKFETIALQAPHWHEGSGAFNTAAFSSFMNTTMASAATAMTSSPSSSSSSSGSSSGGSSSGGGSSGGGSGGGGGSSW